MQAEILEQASTLLMLKDSLGDFYDEQKQQLLSRLDDLPLPSASPILAALVGIKFITPAELSAIITNRTKPKQPTPQPPVVQEQPKPDPLTLDTPLAKIQELVLAQTEQGKQEDVQGVFSIISQMGISSLQDLLNLDQSNRSFNLLDAMIYSDEGKQAFEEIIKIVSKHDCVQQFFSNAQQQIEQQTQLHKESVSIQQRLIKLSSPSASMIVLPNDKNQLVYFATVESDGTALESTGERVFFCLDISASMNHDANDSYQPPSSYDHAASSIRKARELIVQLAVSSVKRDCPVTLICWNSKLEQIIQISPEMFQGDGDSKELPSDEVLAARIAQMTGPDVFKARNGTNFEAAFRELKSQLNQYAAECSRLTVWFLTDGEETSYFTPSGKPASIPSSTSASNYGYFNHLNERGFSQHQVHMLNDLSSTMETIAKHQVNVDFHICQFKEADPVFLRGVREATNGHFHTLKDIANLAQEMNSAAVNSGFQLSFIDHLNQATPVMGSFQNNMVLARGILPQQFLFKSILPVRSLKIRVGSKEHVLSNFSTQALDENLRQAVLDIISLEPALERILAQIKEDISVKSLNEGTFELVKLRGIKSNSLGKLARKIQIGSLLHMLLESVLEVVDSQIDAAQRLIGQFQLQEAQNIDKKLAQKNEMLSTREKLAIGAGLESMQVRLGSGFVNQACMEKRVRQLITSRCAQARKMLTRKCLLAETERGAETLLSLIVLEGEVFDSGREQMVRDYFPAMVADSNVQYDISEELSHDANQVIQSTFRIEFSRSDNSRKEIQTTVLPTLEVYKYQVAVYHCKPLTDDLEESKKKWLDPLSFSSFTELIRESNTLPAYLYHIAENQSPGLIFDAQELLFVLDGGRDSTSYDYFRLFWRFAEKVQGNLVKVPGTFSLSNAALPIAPEPLTNMVLTELMSGLLSECLTGTTMALVASAGLIYTGYLLVHMRKPKISGLDFTRMAEILATVSLWIDNPRTSPRVEELEKIVNEIVGNQCCPASLSGGKYFPVRGLLFSMIDDAHPWAKKHSGLQSECAIRYSKFLVASSTPAANTPQFILDSQFQLQPHLTEFIQTIAQPDADPTMPENFIETADQLYNLINATGEEQKPLVSKFLSEPKHVQGLLKSAFEIFQTRTQNYPDGLQWKVLQRILFVAYGVGTFSTQRLKGLFAAFKSISEFESHMERALQFHGVSEIWDSIILSWISPDQQFMALGYSPKTNRASIWNLHHGSVVQEFDAEQFHTLPEDLLVMLWGILSGIFAKFTWQKRRGNAHGLLNLDYEIVIALKDDSKVAQLSSAQLSEYTAALNHKNPTYSKFVPEKEKGPELSLADHVVAKPTVTVSQTGKISITVAFIGKVDCGKSTTCGHIILDSGAIPPAMFAKYEEAAAKIGRSYSKYAWITDQLKQERERALSIETTYWGINTSQYLVNMLDCPGHTRFLKTIASGIGLADAAVLIVSATPAEFPLCLEGSSLASCSIAAYFGIKQFVVAVNKMDLVGYSEARFQEIVEAVSKFFQKLNVKRETLLFVPVSGWTGEGLVTPSDNMSWFKGATASFTDRTPLTLLEAIDCLPNPLRAPDSTVRFAVTRNHRISGVGSVATGKLLSGSIQAGDALTLLPDNRKVTAKSIEVYQTNRAYLVAGELAAINLPGLGRKDVKRGQILTNAESKLVPVRCFIAQIMLIGKQQIRKNSEPYFFVGSSSFTARIVQLIQKIDRRTQQVVEENPAVLKKGDAALVKIVSRDPVCLEPYLKFGPLGRFTFLMSGEISSVGVIREVFETDPDAAPVAKPSVQARYFK